MSTPTATAAEPPVVEDPRIPRRDRRAAALHMARERRPQISNAAALILVYHLGFNWLGLIGDSAAELPSYMLPTG